ncbi:hypothetical protein G4O51_05250 [Candidatus Bathyarchaeota archaeon A05DMB-2]|nr:hypothetical protein [Candidatus Bathyarchaeota archaeon A05DMB-2]
MAVLVIIIVIAGVVIYMYVGTGGEGGGGGETPTTVYTMGNATSLQFTVNLTDPTGLGIYKFAGKNLDTANVWLRVDATPVVSEGTTYSTIMYAGNQTSWTNATGTWMESDFSADWGTTWSPSWSGYIDHNKDWKTGDGDISYHDEAGNAVLIYDIVINPTLSDSLFTPTS